MLDLPVSSKVSKFDNLPVNFCHLLRAHVDIINCYVQIMLSFCNAAWLGLIPRDRFCFIQVEIQLAEHMY